MFLFSSTLIHKIQPVSTLIHQMQSSATLSSLHPHSFIHFKHSIHPHILFIHLPFFLIHSKVFIHLSECFNPFLVLFNPNSCFIIHSYVNLSIYLNPVIHSLSLSSIQLFSSIKKFPYPSISVPQFIPLISLSIHPSSQVYSQLPSHPYIHPCLSSVILLVQSCICVASNHPTSIKSSLSPTHL